MTNQVELRGASRAPRAPAGKTQVAGAKLLLSASALVATLGRWAFLTAGEKQVASPPQPVAPPMAQQIAPTEPAVEQFALDLAPLPTLVPLATPHAITLTQLAQPTLLAQPVVAAQPTATAQPVVVPTVKAVLRTVNVPPPPKDGSGGGGGGAGQSAPPPATTSRSSR